MSEISEIKDEIKSLKSDMKTMDGRLKDLELKQAYAEGKASNIAKGSNGNNGSNSFEKKVILKLLAIVGGLITAAGTFGYIVGQVITKVAK